MSTIGLIPKCCRGCVAWELEAAAARTAADSGESEFEKEIWLSGVMLTWGSAGQIVTVDDEPVGFALYAPPTAVPGAAAFPTLDELIAQSGFRSDLYYRINVIPLHIPPLRERRDDILPLARHLVKKMAQEATFSDIALDQEAEQLLLSYDWPGNVRELVNVLERAMFSMEGDSIHVCDLPFHLRKKMEPFPGPPSSCLKDEQTKAEKKAIINALKKGDTAAVKAHLIEDIKTTQTLLQTLCPTDDQKSSVA